MTQSSSLSEVTKQALLPSLEKPQTVEVSQVIQLSDQLLQTASVEIIQGVIPIKAKLLHLQRSGVQFVSKAVEAMLVELGNKPSLSPADITRVFTDSATTNDEHYTIAA